MDESNRYLFIITGAPGAGKSTLANKIKDNSPKFISPIKEICEADDYFYIIGHGKYAFDKNLLFKAHSWCQNKVKREMDEWRNVIVSNTNIIPRDRKVYFDFAKSHGYKVVYIHLTTDYGTIHDVPDEAVQRLKDRYIEPSEYEKSLIVKSGEMDDDLASLLAVCNINYEY